MFYAQLFLFILICKSTKNKRGTQYTHAYKHLYNYHIVLYKDNEGWRRVENGDGNFTAPCSAFEHGLYTGHIVIDANPITQWCFGNAVLDTDNMGNTKPRKRSEYQKIDGVITMLMSMRLFLDARR